MHSHSSIFGQCFNPDRKFERPDADEIQNNQQELQKFQGCMSMVGKFAHTFLYCRDPAQILTVSQSKILASERSKYLSFVSKNYKYKIPQEFTSRKLMKQKRDELLKKQKQQQLKHEQTKSKKRPRKPQESVQQPPRKRKKPNGDEKQAEKKKKQSKKNKVQKQEKGKNLQKKDKKKQEEQEDHENQEDLFENNFESEQNLENNDLDAIQDEEN